MLRRTLPVLAAAAVAALVPGTASAAPVQTPESGTFDSIDAGIELTVAGQPGRASLSLRGEPGDRTASLDVTLPPEPCALPLCYRTLRTGSAELSDEQIRVGRDLKVASAVDVPITLYSAGWDAENGTTEIEEPLTVSLTITATSRLSHDVEHGDICGEGWPCHGTHVTAWRGGRGRPHHRRRVEVERRRPALARALRQRRGRPVGRSGGTRGRAVGRFRRAAVGRLGGRYVGDPRVLDRARDRVAGGAGQLTYRAAGRRCARVDAVPAVRRLDSW